MDLHRIVITLIILLFSSLIQALPNSNTNQGIALVHGTKDHREDAYGDYWKIDFIESMSQGLAKPENLFVVHCDFSQYMWHEDAAHCVANQLIEFINDKNISSLTVYTHSNGANVLRFILSNPAYDSKYLILKRTINQVVAIAPSSGGTILADEVLNGGTFETGFAWLLGYLSDAVRQQRVGDMIIYNDELLLGSKGRPSLSIPFRVVLGTNVYASPFSSSSYCNGYLQNSALKLARLYLDDCSDGFLNCSSQLEAGSLWIKDIDRTQDNQPLSHNQSRHSCFGLDALLKTALAKQGA